MTVDSYDKLECLRLAITVATSSGQIKEPKPEEYILSVAKEFVDFMTPVEVIEEKIEEAPVEWISA